MRNTLQCSPEEAILYTYWITILQLLKLGIKWETIMELTENEISLIVGIEAALNQKQADEEARQMSMSSNSMPSMGGF